MTPKFNNIYNNLNESAYIETGIRQRRFRFFTEELLNLRKTYVDQIIELNQKLNASNEYDHELAKKIKRQKAQIKRINVYIEEMNKSMEVSSYQYTALTSKIWSFLIKRVWKLKHGRYHY